MAIIQPEDVKLYLDIPDGSDDVLLDTLVDATQKAIEAYTHRVFDASTNTSRSFDALRDTDPTRMILYLDRDLASINSITNGDSIAVTSGQYVTEPRSNTPYHALRIKANSNIVWTYTTDPENAITISGKWGYSVTPPADVKQAAVRLCAFLYHQKDTTMDLEMPRMSPDGMVLLPSQLPRDVQQLLNPYRRL